MTAGYGTVQPHAMRQSVDWAREVAGYIPTLMLTHPLLINPILYAEELRKTADLRADFVGDFQQADTFLLTAMFYPAVFLLAALCFVVAWPKIDRRTWILLGWGAAFVGYTILSSLWSLAPRYTFLKAGANALVLMITVLPVLVSRDPEKLLRPLFWFCAFLVAINVLSVLSRPPGPIGHEGIYEHKNILGGAAAIFLLFGAYKGLAGRGIEKLVGLGMVPLCVFLLIASESKTALGLTAIAPVFAAFIYVSARWLRLPPLFTIAAMLALMFAVFPLFSLISGYTFEDFLELTVRDKTFTGRVAIWQFSIEWASQRPFLGYGYQGFWNIGADSPRFQATVPYIANLLHSHNGYIQIWLELGLVGVFLFLGLVLTTLKYLSRLISFDTGFAVFALTVMMFILLVNLMETDWFLGATPGTVLFIMIGLLSSMPQARLARGAWFEPFAPPYTQSPRQYWNGQ